MIKAMSRAASTIDQKIDSEDIVAKTRNWYSERYENVLVQRNVLLLIVLLAVAVMAASVFVVGQVTTSKTVEPFVVQIEPKTGFATIVNPETIASYAPKQNVFKYFLVQYIRARESYDPGTFEYNLKTVVRLLSTSMSYYDFLNKMNSDPNSPLKAARAAVKTVKFKSVTIVNDNTGDPKAPKKTASASVRFTVTDTNPGGRTYDKIATVEFSVDEVGLTTEELYVNPVGFRVSTYAVSDDNV